jgi:hypothetical protein
MVVSVGSLAWRARTPSVLSHMCVRRVDRDLRERELVPSSGVWDWRLCPEVVGEAGGTQS